MSTNNKTMAFIVGLYVLIALRPNFTWSIPGNVILLLQIIPVIIFLPRLEMKHNVGYFLAFFLLFLMNCLIQGNNLSYSLFLLSFSIIPFVNKRFTVLSLEYFQKIYAIIMGASMIVLVLVLVGAPIPGSVIAPLNEAKSYNYISYPFLVIPLFTEGAIRFHGPFDEPGVIGTVGFVLLVLNDFRFKNRWWTIIILISCIISFSFAFYAGTIVYFVIRYLLYRDRSSRGFIIVAMIFYLITSQIPFFKETVYSRFKYDEQTGKLAGDNRSTEAQEDYLKTIRWTSAYFWGTNDSDIIDSTFGAAGLVKAIIINGIVFIVLYCMLFWGFAFHNQLSFKQCVLFVALMMVNVYHRPNLFSFAFIFFYMSYIKIRAYENEVVLLNSH